MISGYKFRIATIIMAFTIMIYTTGALISETLLSKRPAFPVDPSRIAAPAMSVFDERATDISPFKGDVEASHAMMLALWALKSDSGKTPEESKALNERAQIAAKAALSLAPCDSQIWLALALLKTRIDPRDPGIPGSLKMSYFTAPNDADLIPVRLDSATVFDAITDTDLADLARGDVRLVLARRPDLRIALSNAYRRGSPQGKAFLEEAVGSIDPKFLAALRG